MTKKKPATKSNAIDVLVKAWSRKTAQKDHWMFTAMSEKGSDIVNSYLFINGEMKIKNGKQVRKGGTA